MSWFLSFRTFAFAIALAASTTFIDAAPTGFLEGHLKIISPGEVDLADQTPSNITKQNYAEYPLVILTRDQHKEIARVSADENGNYRVALPPGEYVLDVQDRRRRHVRATPQPFTVGPNQTVHVNMNLDTGIR